MKKDIIILTDYKGHFGSKQNGIPYRSGFDLKLVSSLFKKYGRKISYKKIYDASDIKNIENKVLLFTSSEDTGYHYKSFIEDILLNLHESNAVLIPDFDFLRANNNKVYMELLRKRSGYQWNDKLDSWVFGTIEEMYEKIDGFSFPIVVKSASGAMSRGVKLAKDKKDLISKAKGISKTKYFWNDIKDYLRKFKHKGYKKDSLHRNKFIVQSFIPDLKNDWKILIYGKKYFVLTRHVRKNDFRASGSHVNYLPGSKSLLPDGLLDFAKTVFTAMDTPNLSLDVIFDGKNFHLIEFQGIYFGTSTILMSDVYYQKEHETWKKVEIKQTIEEIYVDSIMWYLQKDKN